MDKKDLLEGIKDLETLQSIVEIILNKAGFLNVEVISKGLIKAKKKDVFESKESIYILTLSELKGQVSQILDLVKKHHKEVSEILIISSSTKKISDYFKKYIREGIQSDRVDYWDYQTLTTRINEFYPKFWSQSDVFLNTYEDSFLNDISNDSDLIKVLKLEDKYDDFLNIFIEPKIHFFEENEKTQREEQKRLKVENFLGGRDFFLSGEAGTGKTTFLKEIGKKLIEQNRINGGRNIPVLIKLSQLVANEFSLVKTLESTLLEVFNSEQLEEVYGNYKIKLLIDSIDELENTHQKSILSELSNLVEKRGFTFVIASRNYESLTKGCEICPHINAIVSNFDLNQAKQYLDHFFRFDLLKAEELYDSLLENKILERIPSTPLTLSLVSILFEENGYEVPATLTDVYDSFNIFLLGRLAVKTKFEFLEINIKEKILSMYAYEIIKRDNRLRMTKKEFLVYVNDFFKRKSITINKEDLPNLLKRLTEGTGILVVDETGRVDFSHDHFLEYYASREIFNQRNRQEHEKLLVSRFVDFNWQNTAIFYAGRTKEMPEFLSDIIESVQQYSALNHCLTAVSGLGYLIQALWLTDSKIRKEGVLTSLELLLKVDSEIKSLSKQNLPFFKGILEYDIALMNLVWFFKHYNSVTIRDPLKLAFEELQDDANKLPHSVSNKDRNTVYYKMFCIAATLNTGRNLDPSKLHELFDEENILHIPLFATLFDKAINILESSNEAQFRKDYKIASKTKKYAHAINFYVQNSADVLKNTTYELLSPYREYTLLCEGKTDVEIIYHAFRVLNDGKEPYWDIIAVEDVSNAGGATALAKKITTLVDVDENVVVKGTIALFDNDAKGYQEFNGLSNQFVAKDGITKAHSKHDVTALLLPIPNQKEYEPYHQEKQVFKFFEIEHYFDLNFLKEKTMVTELHLNGVFEVTGNKSDFSSEILKIMDAEVFKNFVGLFQLIDSVCGKQINYNQ